MKLLILIFLITLALSAKEYTFSELKTVGVKNSSELLVRKNSILWQDYEAKRKLWDLYLPITTLEVNSSKVTSKEGPFIKGQTTKSADYSTKLKLNYKIFNGFRDYFNLQSERAKLAKKQFYHFRAKGDLIYDISKKYYEAVKEIGYKEIIDQELLRSKKLLGSAKIRYKRGVISKSDLYRSEIELLEAEENLISQKNRINSINKDIQKLIQEKESVTVILKGPSKLSSSIINKIKEYKKVELHEITDRLFHEYENSAEHLLLREELRLLGHEKAVVRADFFPKLNFSLSHNYKFGDSWSRLGVNKQDYSEVGFSLTIPLFNSFNSSMSYSQASLNEESSRYELRAEALNAKIKIEQLISSLLEKFRSYKIQIEKLGFQDKIYNKSFNRYKLGAITTKDLIDDKVELTRTAYKLTDVSYQIRVLGLELDYLVGRLQKREL
jgi:outer membrane protein